MLFNKRLLSNDNSEDNNDAREVVALQLREDTAISDNEEAKEADRISTFNLKMSSSYLEPL